MALPVISNIPSLNAQRNLAVSTNKLAKSLERLSSGLRINRAGDDAAGLAISEGLRSQIRGLDQAVRNANDGLSLIGTAESAINSYTENLQRIRELAIQSANDTNSASNRAALDKEVQQLLEEMQRISTTVEFNGLKLLDGTFTEKQLQVGAQANQIIGISTGNLQTNSLGQVAETVSSDFMVTDTTYVNGSLILNGIDVVAEAGGALKDDGISFANGDRSAISVANAINNTTAKHGVLAEAEPAIFTAANAIAGGSITTGELLINGVDIAAGTTLTFNAGDSNNTLINAINAQTNITGVVATKDASNKLVLTADDGRNITIATDDGLANDPNVSLGLAATGSDFNAEVGGKIRLTSLEDISVAGNLAASKLNIAVSTYSQDPTTAINTTSINSVDGANRAIRIVDFALEEINDIRAGLGAITNRLEQTIGNLQAISENLSASDSRIRDADFATETAELTRNQILQQAGIAILGQANTTTQSALSLLQG